MVVKEKVKSEGQGSLGFSRNGSLAKLQRDERCQALDKYVMQSAAPVMAF